MIYKFRYYSNLNENKKNTLNKKQGNLLITLVLLYRLQRSQIRRMPPPAVNDV
jgi:hypothetical protein